jgi:hypothetical protein
MSTGHAQTDADADGKPLCIVCREPLQPGAQFCVQCKNWQDWTRHLTRWSVVAAAMVALIPLWTAAVSLYSIAFGHADLKVQALSCSAQEITLAVTNSGRRAGILVRSSLVVEMDGESVGSSMLLQPAKEHSLVRPKESFVLSLKPQIEGVPTSAPLNPGGRVCTYHIDSVIQSFEERSETLRTSCRCP